MRPSFVHPLPPGQGYTGLNFFFPQQEDKFSHVNSFHINSIEENIEDIISNNSRPESLVRAVHTFIIGVAFGLMDQEDSDEDKNRSMIIHPHNETSAHKNTDCRGCTAPTQNSGHDVVICPPNEYQNVESLSFVVTIGSSGHNSKFVTVNQEACTITCPAEINRNNWIGGYTYGDTFAISVNGQHFETAFVRI